MENDVVVIAFQTQLDEIPAGAWRLLSPKLYVYVAVVCF